VGIAIGLVSAGLAAANLLIDFTFLRDASQSRSPRWMEVRPAAGGGGGRLERMGGWLDGGQRRVHPAPEGVVPI